VATSALAADRPFLATNSAAAEEDNDQVWSLETTLQRLGPARAATLAVEYAFDPITSLQLEFGRGHDRSADTSASAVEIEFKHLFNHIARDGWGLGIAISLGFTRQSGAGWRSDELRATVPWTLSLWQGDGALHVNAGINKPNSARRRWTSSLAFERQLLKHTTGLVELARASATTLTHAGIRHWIRRDRLALDLSLQRARESARRDAGLVIGVGWYDL
jgi:hypothetical protein